MVASKDKNKSTSAPRKITQSQALLIFSTVIYGIVLVSNFYIHKHLSGPLYVGEGLVADFFADRQERTLGANNGESSKPTYPFGELYDGNAITSILLEQKEPPNDIERLRFKPGTLDLTSQQTLPYCYSDPTIYKQHFPQSLRQVTSISDTHMLIYLMLPKSASSTARWMMDNVLNASDHPLSGLGHELNPGGDYEDYTTLTFVRDPLARFYSSYDEVFLRFGPWMQKRKGNFFKRYNDFKHPFPYLYTNMTDWDDYQNAFCPKSLGWGKKRCLKIKTMENGTLATRFERFVWDYDGISPFDLHLHLQAPHLSNRRTGKPKRIDEIYNTSANIENWEYIANFYGETIPADGVLEARSTPRRFNTSFVSLQTKQRICQLSAIDYCCLNMKLPEECDSIDLNIYCSLGQNKRGDFEIQPWFHPHQIGYENRPAYLTG